MATEFPNPAVDGLDFHLGRSRYGAGMGRGGAGGAHGISPNFMAIEGFRFTEQQLPAISRLRA